MQIFAPAANDLTMRYTDADGKHWRVTAVQDETVFLTRVTLKGTDYKRTEARQVHLCALGWTDSGAALCEAIEAAMAAEVRAKTWAPTCNKVELTSVLGAGAFRVCLATTDPRIAVKIGYGNDDELTNWNMITNGGTTMVIDGIRVPQMRRMDSAEFDFHPEHAVPRGSMDRCEDAQSNKGNFPLAVERVPNGTPLHHTHEDWERCPAFAKVAGKPCHGKCAYKRAEAAFPMLRDLHGANLMVDETGQVWVVDIAM